jgi:hypothetical protein
MMNPSSMMQRLQHAHDNLFEIPSRDVQSLLSDTILFVHETNRALRRQQGKADLQTAREISARLGSGWFHSDNAKLWGFGRETIDRLIEEIEWRRRAMHDPEDGAPHQSDTNQMQILKDWESRFPPRSESGSPLGGHDDA